MSKMVRRPQSKKRSVRQFKKRSARTKAPNIQKTPQRGGWRL